jgi:hypothetical protein
VSALSNSVSENWASFLDVADDVKPFLQIPSTDVSRDQTLQMVTDGVCDWVQRELGRPIGPTRFDRRFDGGTGWNGAHIMLPYYPVLEIVSCVEYWGVSGPHNLLEQTPTNQVDGFTCSYLTGRLTRVFPGLVQKPWFPGARNVEVTWVAGYNPVPPGLRLGMLEVIAWYWRNTQQSSRSFKPTGEYDQPVTQEFWASVLPAMAKPFLDSFLQVGLG